MKGIINLSIGVRDDAMIVFSAALKYYDYNFDIEINESMPFDEIFSEAQRSEVLSTVKAWTEYCEADIVPSKFDTELMKKLEDYKDREFDLLRECEYVRLDMPYEDIVDFLKRNPSLLGKKIVINSSIHDVSRSEFEHIRKTFGEYTSFLRFDLYENDDIITLEEFEKTFEALEEKVNKIKSYGFSPLEATMQAYDIARDRKYKEETSEEDDCVSRSLTSVLFGDYVVCTGFARLFSAMLQKLGIKSRLYTVKNSDGENHDQVVVLIDDDKYDVHGVYYFDVTAGAKFDDTNRFLYSYKYFALTKNQCIDLNGDFRGIVFEDFGFETVDEFVRVCKEGKLGVRSYENARAINSFSSFVKGKPLIQDAFQMRIASMFGHSIQDFKADVLEDDLNDLLDMIDSPIPAEVFVKVLYNVRKRQYYEEPEKYPFGVSALYSVFKYSGWRFEDEALEKILNAIFKDKVGIEDKSEKLRFCEFLDEDNLRQQIEGIILTRTLKAIAESFDGGKRISLIQK